VSANGYYEELQTAKAWGIRPKAWRELPKTEREEMIAEYRATGKKDAAIFEFSKKSP